MNTILIAIISYAAGFLSDYILYNYKRRDKKHDDDIILLHSIIDEVCIICKIAEELIDAETVLTVKIERLRKEHIEFYEISNISLDLYMENQEKMLKIYSKEHIDKFDLEEALSYKKQYEEHYRQYRSFIDLAIEKPKAEKKLAEEFNSKVASKLRTIYSLSNRLNNAYKFFNKRTSKKVGQLLRQLDKTIKTVIDKYDRSKNHKVAQSVLLGLYKTAVDTRYDLTKLIK